MNAIILCGGLSTRLGEITKSVPKILLEIGKKTVLDWQLEKLKSIGINKVVLAAGHLAGVLREKIGDERLEIELIYAIEDKRLGTGGAIKHGLEYVEKSDEPTIILNGDVLTTVDLQDMLKYLKPDSDGIILGSFVDDVATYGTLEYDKSYHLTAFKEKEGIHKPGYQNGGIYIFNSSVKKYFPEQDEFSIEYDVFPKMKDLYVYESDRPWIDVGVPERLEWARENYKKFDGN
jgi:D-glycero-alpha-D-manno-heptose 1-phosphate guanylyltransferase